MSFVVVVVDLTWLNEQVSPLLFWVSIGLFLSTLDNYVFFYLCNCERMNLPFLSDTITIAFLYMCETNWQLTESFRKSTVFFFGFVVRKFRLLPIDSRARNFTITTSYRKGENHFLLFVYRFVVVVLNLKFNWFRKIDFTNHWNPNLLESFSVCKQSNGSTPPNHDHFLELFQHLFFLLAFFFILEHYQWNVAESIEIYRIASKFDHF